MEEKKTCSCSSGCEKEETSCTCHAETHDSSDHCSCHREHGEDSCHCHDDDEGCGCGCGCGGGHDCGDEEKNELSRQLPRLTVGAALFVLCLILEHTTQMSPIVWLIAYLIPYLLVGWETLWISAKRIAHGAVFDENFLMSIASIGAFCVGQYEEGAAVMLLYHLGEWLEDLAVGRTRASVRALLAIRPDTARIVCEEDGDCDEVAVEAVGIGAAIEVRPGERIPLDGCVLSGLANLDTAALTGESLPRTVTVGDSIAAGCIVTDGVLRIRVTHTAGESTVQRILDLAQHAAEKK